MNFTDLPVGVLTNVAFFLPKPSRALFAVSLTAPSSSWQDTSEQMQLSETSKAIISPSSQWEILDFEEVEKSLAKKLNDDDLYAVLTCIKQTIKILNLTGCINITGRGLTPLQFSTALELIDLSLLKKQADSSRLESRICQEVVLPILGSIISVQGCSLKHIQFPYEWIRARGEERFMNFNNSYAQHLYRLGISCSKCNNIIRCRMPERLFGEAPGVVRFCCYSCLKPLCVNCEGTLQIDTNCGICKKVYCSGCSRVNQGNLTWANQGERCAQCQVTVCSGCKHNHMSRCSGCDARRCNNCLRISGPLCRNCIEDDNDDLDWFEEELDVDWFRAPRR